MWRERKPFTGGTEEIRFGHLCLVSESQGLTPWPPLCIIEGRWANETGTREQWEKKRSLIVYESHRPGPDSKAAGAGATWRTGKAGLAADYLLSRGSLPTALRSA